MFTTLWPDSYRWSRWVTKMSVSHVVQLVSAQHGAGEDAATGASKTHRQQQHHGFSHAQLPLQAARVIQWERATIQLHCKASRSFQHLAVFIFFCWSPPTVESGTPPPTLPSQVKRRRRLNQGDTFHGVSPYCLPIINNFVTPVPPAQKRKEPALKINPNYTLRGRRLRPNASFSGADIGEVGHSCKWPRRKLAHNEIVLMPHLLQQIKKIEMLLQRIYHTWRQS